MIMPVLCDVSWASSSFGFLPFVLICRQVRKVLRCRSTSTKSSQNRGGAFFSFCWYWPFHYSLLFWAKNKNNDSKLNSTFEQDMLRSKFMYQLPSCPCFLHVCPQSAAEATRHALKCAPGPAADPFQSSHIRAPSSHTWAHAADHCIMYI